MSRYTYNEFHLGDNIVHLHFLRQLALAHPDHAFIHAVHECHIKQLKEVVEDLENIMLIPLPEREKYAPLPAWINTWKNAGEFWARHHLRCYWVGFHLDWFRYLARLMGYKSPFKEAKDFWFDYPAIEGEHLTPALSPLGRGEGEKDYDFLVINSQPCSGQLKPYDGLGYFTPLVEALARKGYRILTTDPLLREAPAGHSGPLPPAIPCTRDFGLSITGVGTISRRCKNIIAVATGPLWPCLNKWNMNPVAARPEPPTPIIILLDHVLGEERLTGLGDNITQVKSREAVMVHLGNQGIL